MHTNGNNLQMDPSDVFSLLIDSLDEISDSSSARTMAHNLVNSLGSDLSESIISKALIIAAEGPSPDRNKLLGIPENAPEKQAIFRVLHLYKLVYFISKERGWPLEIKAAGLAPMMIYTDQLQQFDEAIEWGQLILETTSEPEIL